MLKETLRLWPTAPGFAVHSLEPETIIGGKYLVRQDQTLIIPLPVLHRDPKVWGPDPEKFDPERFSFEAAEKLPPNAWKPFGNGQRACIGRPFALQEATLVLAMVLQRFDLSLADPSYKLQIKQTLTIKPTGFFIHAKRRADMAVKAVPTATVAPVATAAPAVMASQVKPNGIPIQVLFGSNAGSAEAFAQRIATDAQAQGYTASLAPLDSGAGHLPSDGAVVIVTASYEGQPPDNARQFVSWLDGVPAESLKGIKYAVFGCGNKDWARTYQAVPKKVDSEMQAAGAVRLLERGEADARGDFFGDFDRWYAPFWSTVGAAFGQETHAPEPLPLFAVEFVAGVRDPILRQNNLKMGDIVDNKELVNVAAPNARSKRHVEVALPEGSQYRAGDYLAVLAMNPSQNVERALHRFDLAYDAQVVIRMPAGGQTFFPTGQPVTAGELLASYVELAQPATRKQIEQLATSTTDQAEKQALSDFDRER